MSTPAAPTGEPIAAEAPPPIAARPLISVIVISRDDAPGLAATLASIRSQSFRDIEVVVVTKGTSTSAVNLDGLPHGIHFEQSTSGISNAFNEAIRAAQGAWINFLNGGDVFIDAAVLQSIAAELVPPRLVVTGRARDEHVGLRIPRDRSFAARNLELVSHQASFFAASLFAAHGLYSEAFRIRMDFEWMLRLPADTPTHWVDRDLVGFAGAGVSSVRPWKSSLEELAALRRHRKGFSRIALLLCGYVPWRLARAALRRLGS